MIESEQVLDFRTIANLLLFGCLRQHDHIDQIVDQILALLRRRHVRILLPISLSADVMSLSWMSMPLARATTASLSCAHDTVMAVPNGAETNAAKVSVKNARRTDRRVQAMKLSLLQKNG